MDGSQPLSDMHAVLRHRMAGCADARLAAIVGDLVEAIGGVIQTHRVSRADLQKVVRFATDVGHASKEKRNEWVLLADAMGVTAAVETSGAERPCGATPQTLLGPFFREGAPRKRSGDCLSIDGVGRPLTFAARVCDLDGDPIAGACVDVWHANGEGKFENQDPDSQPEFNLRGEFETDRQGSVTFHSVRPAGYRLPDDGPVAEVMRRLGLSMWRPAHIQFRITAAGFEPLVTHVFDRDDPQIDADALFCVSPALLADFGDPASPEASQVRFTFKLPRSRPGIPSN
ncbi:MAG: dioxygenase [Sulfitobacter sp.]